jgi:hypothetical protein
LNASSICDVDRGRMRMAGEEREPGFEVSDNSDENGEPRGRGTSTRCRRAGSRLGHEGRDRAWYSGIGTKGVQLLRTHQLLVLCVPFPPVCQISSPLHLCSSPLDLLVRRELDGAIGGAREGEEGALVESPDTLGTVYGPKPVWKGDQHGSEWGYGPRVGWRCTHPTALGMPSDPLQPSQTPSS